MRYPVSSLTAWKLLPAVLPRLTFLKARVRFPSKKDLRRPIFSSRMASILSSSTSAGAAVTAAPPVALSLAASPQPSEAAAPASAAATTHSNRKELTLLFILTEDKILLGHKRRGWAKNFINGFGGKLDPGESIVEGAVREAEEECGVKVLDPQLVGHILFEFAGHADQLLNVHVFKASAYEGEPRETEEMTPEWFPLSDIPFPKMWKDDSYWLPTLLSGKLFDAYFLFEGHHTILEHWVREVESAEQLPYKPGDRLVTKLQSSITI